MKQRKHVNLLTNNEIQVDPSKLHYLKIYCMFQDKLLGRAIFSNTCLVPVYRM